MMDDPRRAPIRRYENVSAMWAWVAAASALLLIGFILVASWNSNIVSSNSSQPTRPAAPRHRRVPRAPLVIAEAVRRLSVLRFEIRHRLFARG